MWSEGCWRIRANSISCIRWMTETRSSSSRKTFNSFPGTVKIAVSWSRVIEHFHLTTGTILKQICPVYQHYKGKVKTWLYLYPKMRSQKQRDGMVYNWGATKLQISYYCRMSSHISLEIALPSDQLPGTCEGRLVLFGSGEWPSEDSL